MPRALLPALLLLLAVPAQAQRFAHVDSDYILGRVTEYQTAQSELDRLAQQWQSEVERMEGEVEALVADFQARELLYTEEERDRKRTEIEQARRELEAFRLRHFGPEGELFREQQRLMRPVQERVLEAIEAVAEAENYDYVFDKSGDFLFLYARPQMDVSDLVLEELGIDPLRAGR